MNYADDFVICCRGTAEAALTATQAMMRQLKLTVNPQVGDEAEVRRKDRN